MHVHKMHLQNEFPFYRIQVTVTVFQTISDRDDRQLDGKTTNINFIYLPKLCPKQ